VKETSWQEAPVSEQVVMSLGVDDIERAKQFYTDGLGLRIDQDHGYFVSFKHGSGGTALGAYTGNPLAYDAGLVTDDAGHRGVTLACMVESAELMAQAENAGAKIVEPAHTAAWGGYIGYFTDPFGNLWKIVVRQSG
jgi:uncharacterized protein